MVRTAKANRRSTIAESTTATTSPPASSPLVDTETPSLYKPPTIATKSAILQEEEDDTPAQLALIAASQRTPFEKRVWTALLSIPRGHVTTYGLLSAHLGTSPRAVGNALRRNPFAPGVPCHRVVATGGGLGGFKGSWKRKGDGQEKEGITLLEKRRLLRGEGVRFDGGGKVVGTPWGFK